MLKELIFQPFRPIERSREQPVNFPLDNSVDKQRIELWIIPPTSYPQETGESYPQSNPKNFSYLNKQSPNSQAILIYS